MRRWIFWGALALLIVAVGAWIAGRMLGQANATSVQQVVPTAVPQDNRPELERLQEQLLDPRLDVEARESMMKKIDLLKQAEADRQAGGPAPAPKVPPEFPQQNQVLAPAEIETGIFPGSEGMVKPSVAQINNYWQGPVDGQVVMAFAGALSDDPQQGALILATIPGDPMQEIGFVTYLSPAKGGTLRVSSETEGILTLSQADGAMLRFDMRARTYLP